MTTGVTPTVRSGIAPGVTSSISVLNDSHELRHCWHPVARSTEISDRPSKVWLLGQPLVVYRIDGQVVVLSDQCPHRRTPLSAGRVVDGVIECPYHGWRFRSDGRCVLVPSASSGPIPPNARVAAPQVIERGGLIFVALEDPLVGLPVFDVDDTDVSRRVALDPYEGRLSAAMLIDNQLDIAHFSFVHLSTFGVADETDTPRYEVAREEWGFSIEAEVPIEAGNDALALTGVHPLRQYRTMRYRYVAPYFVEITLDYPVMGGSMVVTFFAQPQRFDQARLYVGLTFSHPDGLEDDELEERVSYERRVLAEDLALQLRFDVLDLPLGAGEESHVRADRASVEYRRLLTQLFLAARSIDHAAV
jgi:phenylpropionate dioxygenase-like ring-hydroxylating dioxygenase large terminal subunit